MVEFNTLGPEKIIEVYHPKIGMHGILVIDNTTLGPGKGGIRMTPAVSRDELSRMARIMTLKCSMAGLPFGGAKSGIIANPKLMPWKKKRSLIKAFSEALKIACPNMYSAAPDMNMGEKEMEVFAKTNGSKKSCTGKPKYMGGIPHELGSTGYGVFISAKVASKHIGLDLKDATVAIEGFGNVGSFAARFLSGAGAKLICVSDSKGCIYNKEGIDLKQLINTKERTKSVINYKHGKILQNKDIIKVKPDILVTAAIPDIITKKEVNKVKAKLIIEGSNIPITHEAENLLHKQRTLIIPDFIANAGGLISSWVEYFGGKPKQAFKHIENKINKNTKAILKETTKDICPRDIAVKIAEKRILRRCKVCK